MKLCNLSIKVLSEKKIIVYVEHLIAEFITSNVKKVDAKPLIPPFLVYPSPRSIPNKSFLPFPTISESIFIPPHKDGVFTLRFVG